MKRVMQWVLASIFVCGASIFASCSKGGDVIYEPDPADEASTSPLVAVIYDPNALGDRGYNDLIYQGVEKAARWSSRHPFCTIQTANWHAFARFPLNFVTFSVWLPFN